MKPVLLQPVFVLHRRAYRETSFLIEVFSHEHGRLSLIAKGVRKSRSSLQGLLQPFIPLSISWSGRNELVTLTHAELHAESIPLAGESLYAGFYLNELISILLPKWDPHPNLFECYSRTLDLLKNTPLQEATLRSFELYLLQELGYGLLPTKKHGLSEVFLTDKYYQFVPEQGFVLVQNSDEFNLGPSIFLGKNLLAIAHEDWHDKNTLSTAKRLVRCVLTPLLGNRELHSRQLFMAPKERIIDGTHT
jgi:DNA repair protein RecO (recombination protein O)